MSAISILDKKRAALCVEYEAWQKRNHLSLGSADEHLFDESLTKAQQKWLASFCRRWDLAAEEVA